MAYVLDASIAASWAFPDEHDPLAALAGRLLETRQESAIVPPLWWYEIRNVLIVNERRGRTVPSRTALFLEQLKALSIQVDSNLESAVVLELARTYRLSVYDAAYLALAIRNQCPLATLDKALQSAALAENLPALQEPF